MLKVSSHSKEILIKNAQKINSFTMKNKHIHNIKDSEKESLDILV